VYGFSAVTYWLQIVPGGSTTTRTPAPVTTRSPSPSPTPSNTPSTSLTSTSSPTPSSAPSQGAVAPLVDGITVARSLAPGASHVYSCFATAANATLTIDVSLSWSVNTANMTTVGLAPPANAFAGLLPDPLERMPTGLSSWTFRLLPNVTGVGPQALVYAAVWNTRPQTVSYTLRCTRWARERFERASRCLTPPPLPLPLCAASCRRPAHRRRALPPAPPVPHARRARPPARLSPRSS
jgi:hypothetical protein